VSYSVANGNTMRVRAGAADTGGLYTLLEADQIAGTGPPLHMGIVVKLPGNRWSVLEAGPDDGIWVELRDLVPRLHQFTSERHGTITIRRARQPLSYERSAALTVFAQRQAGKRYAVAWLLLQGTPFRVRGPLEPFLARTRLDPPSWICSEISIAAGTVAGLFDPKVVPSNVAYPRDLVDNHRYNLSASWLDPEIWTSGLMATR
jgi:hypothetical protein